LFRSSCGKVTLPYSISLLREETKTPMASWPLTASDTHTPIECYRSHSQMEQNTLWKTLLVLEPKGRGPLWPQTFQISHGLTACDRRALLRSLRSLGAALRMPSQRSRMEHRVLRHSRQLRYHKAQMKSEAAQTSQVLSELRLELIPLEPERLRTFAPHYWMRASMSWYPSNLRGFAGSNGA